MLNYKPKLAEVDPDNPNMWARCDRCGFITNANKMVWQWDYRGTPSPINTRILTCGRPTCLDVPQVQNSPIILSPDPEPVFNARPYPYEISEASFLLTEDGSVITTEDGTYLETGIPDPSENAATAHLQCSILAHLGSVAVCYLDIFNGNPSHGGVSVLSSITGSSVRTDIASSLTTQGGIAQNLATITVASESDATVNTNYVGIYSASISGALLMSGACSVRGQTVTEGNPVVFDALALTINLN